MHVSRQSITETKFKLDMVADQKLLDDVKAKVLGELGRGVKIQGFREGKAPLNLVEKSIDPNRLQTEFLEQAVNRLYAAAVAHEKLRPVTQPQVNITKFVPFSTLEVSAEVEAVGQITLPDYKKIKLAKPATKVEAKDIDSVLKDLRARLAEKQEVKRAAKAGDETIIDFKGSDAKTKDPIAGADGHDYPLLLGSNSFIPGFEDNLLGLKAGDTKTFKLTFPKDYGVKALQNRQVNFDVSLKKVNAVELPKADDALAARVGPFKTHAELKADIKKQVQAEREQQAEREYENQLLEQIAQNTKVAIPTTLIDEEIERQEQNERQNLTYRGQTWQEHLAEEGVTEEEHRAQKRPEAELRVRAGLALSEIVEQENLDVTPEELEMRLQLLKGQYSDAAMQTELDKPETRRELASRILSEKTIAKLKSYASK